MCALRRLRRSEEAFVWFEKAIALQPSFADAFGNKLVALFHLDRFGELVALSDRMMSLGISNEVTAWNVSLAHLLTGNFEAGWLGEERIEGKTILIAADQG